MMTNVIAYEVCSEAPRSIYSDNHVYCVAPARERSYIQEVNTFFTI